jgi:hypothetical protein
MARLSESDSAGAAFVLWTANQLWPNSALATLWNGIALALRVVAGYEVELLVERFPGMFIGLS